MAKRLWLLKHEAGSLELAMCSEREIKSGFAGKDSARIVAAVALDSHPVPAYLAKGDLTGLALYLETELS